MMKKQKKLGTYLAVTAGAGCAASVADGAVTFFGPGAQNPESSPSTPAGVEIGYTSMAGAVDISYSYFSVFASALVGGYFTQGDDLSGIIVSGYGAAFGSSGGASNGAVFNSDQNYANISFDGNDGVYEAVGLSLIHI